MRKNHNLVKKYRILILMLCLLILSGCSNKDKKNNRESIIDLSENYDSEDYDNIVDIYTDVDEVELSMRISREYKTMQDTKLYSESDERILFGTYRIERKLGDAWIWIQQNLHYQDFNVSDVNKFRELSSQKHKLSIEPIEIQFGYKASVDLGNEAAISENALTYNHISDFDMKAKETYYLEKLDDEVEDAYIENLHKLYDYKIMCALYAENGQEYRQSKKKAVLSGTYIYYIYELDGDNILYTPLEINKDTLEVTLPAKDKWKKMKYGFTGNSLIVDIDGYEIDLVSYGAMSCENSYFDVRGYVDTANGYNDVTGMRLYEGDDGVKHCFISFKDGSSTWELNGATFELSEENEIEISWTGNEHPAKSKVYKLSENPGEIKGHLLYAFSPYTSENNFIIVGETEIYYFLSDEYDPSVETVSNEVPEEISEDITEEMIDEKIPEDKAAEVEETQKEIATQLNEGFEENEVEVEVNEDTGKTILDNSILFKYNSAKLSTEGKEYLDKFLKVYADVLTNETFEGKINTIKIEGHADISGTFEHNLELSQKRAESVADYFRQTYPELAAFIETEGKSYKEPIYNEDGTVNNKASRRVEFKIILNY